MRSFSRCFRQGLAALTLGVAVVPARAAAGPDLPVEGVVSGVVKIDDLPDLGLPWNVSFAAGALTLASERPGVDIAVELRPAGAGAWNWTLLRGRLDVAELWPILRAKLGPHAAGWSASGVVELAGAGTWSASAGATGELRLALREGWARSDELDLEVSGVALDLVSRDLAAGALSPTQTLSVGKISMAGVELGSFQGVFGLDEERVFQLVSGEARLLGGSMRLRPLRLPLKHPAADAAADLESLRLDELVRWMPWLLQSAQGKLSGRMEVAWDDTRGVRMRDGGLEIVKSDDAAFRFAPSPGLLTRKVPKRFAFLPWRWARWIGVKNPAYEPLRDIEMGREGLRIERFQIRFRPDGPGVGRTAAIHIVGRPTGGKLVKEVRLDLNFHGPWSEFLAFGLNNDFSGISFRFDEDR